MAEGRLQIYQAAYSILDFLVDNRAVSENRPLTYREMLDYTGMDGDLFGAAYNYLRSSGYVMAPISEEEMWVTPQGMKFHLDERVNNMLHGQNKWLDNLIHSLQQPRPAPPHPGNIINYGHIYNSQIQQGSVDSSQTGSFTSIPIDELRSLLGELKGSFPVLALSNYLKTLNRHQRRYQIKAHANCNNAR